MTLPMNNTVEKGSVYKESLPGLCSQTRYTSTLKESLILENSHRWAVGSRRTNVASEMIN